MIELKRIDYLKRLETTAFLRFCRDMAEVITKFGLTADAERLGNIVVATETAFAESRKNPYTVERNMIVRAMQSEVAVMAASLRRKRDNDGRLAYRVYSNVLKGNTRIAMRKYVEAVSVFLASIKDIHLDVVEEKKRESIAALLDDYNAVEKKRLRQRDAILARTSSMAIRPQLHELVTQICAKVVLMEGDVCDRATESLNNLIVDYRKELPRK